MRYRAPMRKSLLFSRTFFLLSFAAAFGIACGHRTPARVASGTVLEVSDSILLAARRDTFDLGRLREGERVVKEFALKNTDGRPFVVSRAESDCGCILSEYDRRPVLPGEHASLEVAFDSRGYWGYVLKRVEVLTTLRSEIGRASCRERVFRLV